MKSLTTFALLLPFLLLACQNSEQQNTDTPNSENSNRTADYPKIAKEICTCAQPSIELHQQLLDFQRKRNKKAILELIPKAEQTALETIECSQNSRKVKQTPDLNEEALDKALRSNCSNLPVMLREELVLKLVSNGQ